MSNDEKGTVETSINLVDFLRQILEELSVDMGAIWVAEEGNLVPMVSIGFEDSGLFDSVDGKKFLQQLLLDTLNQGRAQTFDTEGLIEPPAFGHATLFFSPVLIPNDRPGVVLVVERPNLTQQHRQGLMRHIEQRCQEISRHAMLTADASLPPEFATAFTAPVEVITPPSEAPTFVSTAPVLTATPTHATGRDAANSDAVLEYLLSLQRSLDLTEVANVIVNDGRILFGVDRVGLAICNGRRVRIKAISGQESVHPRGNLIRTLRRLTQKVVTAGEPFRFDGALNSVPKQLEELLADFIQEAGSRFLLIVPLHEPERLIKPDEVPGHGKTEQKPRRTIGALIIEQMSSSEPSTQLKTVLDSVTDHIAAATYNSRSHSSIFLLPVWRALGRFFEWLKGRRLALAFVLLVALAGLVTALVIVPWPYRVDARGMLMPVTQREVFAPEDGQVDELFVHGDELVNEGDPLIKLINHELEAESVKLQNELHEKKKLLNSLRSQENEAEKQSRTEEKLRAQGKRVETQVEIEGAQAQYDMLKKRLERLIIRAPIKGKVTTFQMQQLLLNRPVKKGEVLLQVMDEDGEWHLELEIAEHRVGRILKAQKTVSAELPIEYRLLTSPESSFQAKLESLATRTVTAEEKGSVLEARAILNKDKLPKATIGAEVRARVGCGESFLGDVLFGDVIEFVQKYLWW